MMSKCILQTAAILLALGWGQAAWGQTSITASQGDFSADIVPLTSALNAVDEYQYQGYKANMGLEQAGHSVLFFHQNPSGALSLIVVHGPPALDVTNSTGIARFIFSDLPAGSRLDLRDDADDQFEFSPPAARVRWKWYPGRTDGLIISQLGDDFSIQITPHFIQGVSAWDLVTFGPEGPQLVPLPALDQSLILSMGAAAGRGVRAAFKTIPADPLYAFIPVTFDARDSLAPQDSRLILYEWDFDGDGMFEAHSEKAVVSQVFMQSGAVRVTLRVTSSGGSAAVVSKTLNLLSPPSVRAVRGISTSSALPGSTFRVTLTLHVDQNLAGLGVEEVWPPSWVIESVQGNGAVLKAQRGQWVFPEALKAGQTKRIVYDVTVPSVDKLNELPEVYQVEGTLTGDLPPFRIAVDGETSVEVASCLPTAVALAHVLVDDSRVDLRMPETIQAAQLAYAQTRWLEGEGLPLACSLELSLVEFERLASYRMLQLPVDQSLPDGGVGSGVRVSRTIMTALPDNQLLPALSYGNRFRVRLDVQALRQVTHVGISEVLPFGWEIEPLDLPDVIYNPRQAQWLLIGPLSAGQVRSVFYDVQVPAASGTEVQLIRGSAYLPDSLFSEMIVGEYQVLTLECLPVLLAVAHWNTSDHTIDLSLDNVIQPHQAQAALDAWLSSTPIPGTCGQLPDLETLRLINRYAQEGIPIDEPLPEGTTNP